MQKINQLRACRAENNTVDRLERQPFVIQIDNFNQRIPERIFRKSFGHRHHTARLFHAAALLFILFPDSFRSCERMVAIPYREHKHGAVSAGIGTVQRFKRIRYRSRTAFGNSPACNTAGIHHQLGSIQRSRSRAVYRSACFFY